MLLNFNFLAILNLMIIILWPATGTYTGTRSSVFRVIMIILTIIAVVLDIVFLAQMLIHG